MKRRSVIYFQEKRKAKVIIAGGGYYMKKGKYRLHTSQTFAERNRERRQHGKREYKDVLAFSPDFEQSFPGPSLAEMENTVKTVYPNAVIQKHGVLCYIQDGKDGDAIGYSSSDFDSAWKDAFFSIKPRPPILPDNPFIRAHVHLATLDEHNRYATTVTHMQPRQHSYVKHLTEYHEWLIPRLAYTTFIVTGKTNLYAISIPDKGFPEFYFKSEFLDQIGESYKKLMQLIKEAKPKE